jgi:hypothetical protein
MVLWLRYWDAESDFDLFNFTERSVVLSVFYQLF